MAKVLAKSSDLNSASCWTVHPVRSRHLDLVAVGSGTPVSVALTSNRAAVHRKVCLNVKTNYCQTFRVSGWQKSFSSTELHHHHRHQYLRIHLRTYCSDQVLSVKETELDKDKLTCLLRLEKKQRLSRPQTSTLSLSPGDRTEFSFFQHSLCQKKRRNEWVWEFNDRPETQVGLKIRVKL